MCLFSAVVHEQPTRRLRGEEQKGNHGDAWNQLFAVLDRSHDSRRYAYLHSHGQAPLDAVIGEGSEECEPAAKHVEDDIVENNDHRELSASLSAHTLCLVDTDCTADHA